MGVYKVQLAGRRKPILLRAANKTAAIDRVVEECKSLTGEEVEEALDNGESLWKAGDELPADDVAKEDRDEDETLVQEQEA